MKKNLFVRMSVSVFCGLLTACASLGAVLGSSFIDDKTSVIMDDGTVILSPDLEMAASWAATRDATYQIVRQFEVWDFVGWDFEFDKTALSAAIAKGTHRLGPVVNNVGWGGGNRTVYSTDNDGNVVATSAGGKGSYLIDPSKPSSYRAVQVKRIENRTVDVVDAAKKEAALKLYRLKYQIQIFEFCEEDTIPAAKNAVTIRLEKRLKEFGPGTILVHWDSSKNVTLAYFVNDDIVCEMIK